MFSVTEAQLLAWLNPLLWPFIRTLALFAGMPTFSQRNVPLRLRIGLSLFIAVAAQPSLPAMPVTPLDSVPMLTLLVAQQLLIGLSPWASRCASCLPRWSSPAKSSACRWA